MKREARTDGSGKQETSLGTIIGGRYKRRAVSHDGRSQFLEVSANRERGRQNSKLEKTTLVTD
jgi:hypothetical protein